MNEDPTELFLQQTLSPIKLQLQQNQNGGRNRENFAAHRSHSGPGSDTGLPQTDFRLSGLRRSDRRRRRSCCSVQFQERRVHASSAARKDSVAVRRKQRRTFLQQVKVLESLQLLQMMQMLEMVEMVEMLYSMIVK